MAWRVDGNQADVAHFNRLAIGEQRRGVLGAGAGRQIDSRARAVSQLEMAGQEIGMEVGEQHMPDLQLMLGGECRY